MNLPRSRLLCLLALSIVVGALAEAARAVQLDLIDDRATTVQSARDVAARRGALIQYLWGGQGFPKRRQPDLVLANVVSPVAHLGNLARVDEIRVDLMPGLQGLAYHFVPLRANRELVIVHHGHACTLDDDPAPAEAGYGLQRTIAGLLNEGYGVLGVFMPHMRPGDCTGAHETLFQDMISHHALKEFILPELHHPPKP